MLPQQSQPRFDCGLLFFYLYPAYIILFSVSILFSFSISFASQVLQNRRRISTPSRSLLPAMAPTSSAAMLAADQTFGPQLRGHFDFTLLFQHTILTLLPSALLIVSCPTYVYYQMQRTAVIDAGWLL